MRNVNLLIKGGLTVVAAAILVTISSTVVTAQGNVKRDPPIEIINPINGTLEGTWMTTVTFEDEFELKVLFTFSRNGDGRGGTLIDQNEYQFTPNPVCTADQGVWQPTGARAFIATHYAFCFDAEAGYEPAGSVKVRDRIQLNKNGDAFTGTQHIEIFDVHGELTDEFDADMRGEKLAAEAPPEKSETIRRMGKQYQKLLRLSSRKPRK